MIPLRSVVPALVLCLAVTLAPAVTPAVTPAVASAAPAAAGSARYSAPRGPFFNDPRGGPRAQYRIERKLIGAIRHTHKGAYIRIAVYSFDRMPVANALLAARRRGVHVQLLLNDHQDTRAMKVLRARLGTDRWAKDFIYKCRSGCRSTVDQYRNLHSKLYTFTQTGRSRHVVAVGSANLMRNAAVHQWNDLYFTSGARTLFTQFVDVFKDMKHDYRTTQPARHFCGVPSGASCDDSVDKRTAWIFPKRSTRRSDLVLNMLGKVQCLTPTASGGQARTELVLSMHTMRGQRGNYLAAAVRRKWAEGCDVRVSYGLIGFHTKKILGAATARGRVPMRSTGLDYHPDDDFDLNKDGKPDKILDYYTHQKYFVVRGTYNGHPGTSMVLTGSSNWASLGTAQDEVFFTVKGRGTARKYVRNFDHMWRGKGNSRNAYTTTYTDFRVPARVRTADGTLRTVVTTVRRPVTSIERDPFRPGPYWEGD